MPSFLARLLRPSRARGQRHAPPAQGQAQVTALLNPDAFGSDTLDDFVRVIQQADPQAQRGRGLTGRGRHLPTSTSSAPSRQGFNGSYFLTPETEGSDNDTNSRIGTSYTSGPVASNESFVALTPPASLLIEADPGSLHSLASSYNSSPDSQGPNFLRDLGAALEIAAAMHDSDASTLTDSELSADSLYDADDDAQDLSDLGASLPISPGSNLHTSSEPSGSQAPGNGGDQVPPPLDTSVLSFSTDNSEDFTVRIPGESTHTSPASSYHSASSGQSHQSEGEAVLRTLREEERYEEGGQE
ncbi:hypothetical protein VMCG_01366 [Cytospora schulzeri]|uniref:Uncharacterized protein n=1 Tax=Cytospora schulzeri TaxID=448051 RepID=A0A423X678_9PEZI|nr:hypothetical protein VMCG_01366 [Valsa malicola]